MASSTLRLEGGDGGFGHFEVGAALLERLLGGAALRGKLDVALPGPLGQCEFCFPAGELGREIGDGGPVDGDLGRVLRWVDLGDELTFLDLVPQPDLELDELPRDLGADVDVFRGGEHAQGRDRFADAAAGGLGGGVVFGCALAMPPGEVAARGEQQDQCRKKEAAPARRDHGRRLIGRRGAGASAVHGIVGLQYEDIPPLSPGIIGTVSRSAGDSYRKVSRAQYHSPLPGR